MGIEDDARYKKVRIDGIVLDELVAAYRPRHPIFADWVERNAAKRSAAFCLTEAHRPKMRTINASRGRSSGS